jgi:aspartate/methionine/tyrosine aminotransferase
MNPSQRLASIGDYYFARKRQEIRTLENQGGIPFLSMAIGNPDLPPPDEVLDALKKHLYDEGAHKYQPYSGLPSFKKAIAEFYRKRFGVDLNPETHILPLMGSKSGIMWLSLAYLNEGDKVLIPEPGYMAYGSVTRLAGGITETFGLNPSLRWQPDLDALSEKAREAKIMWLNYTNMPTGTVASAEFVEKAVEFARKNNIILAFDNPYSLISDQFLSVLKYAKDAPVVEFQSMSKNFNMAGWRLGWIAGRPDIVKNVAKVQNNVESGIFYPLQKAAETALKLSDKWIEHINRVYNLRKEKVREFIRFFNGKCPEKSGGMFCWVELPEEISGEELADKLFYEHRIFVAPGTIFGKKWKNYIRISLTVPVEIYDEAIQRLKQ